ncbi:FAD-dependent oxidoreductase [Halorubellus sp. JP-L1]|uniref:L-aspartate oxidase n=1 Tax=Halorubellus sp. JP-L1 TaxID=2715753 RepID=UPI00140E2BDD|nr:FAD-dependent oxidoreductase [Halorubellus sp. JP-L1]NHN41221.1 FAD-dependent oxidoreductase [Halorubellus sp. JP-L1]
MSGDAPSPRVADVLVVGSGIAGCAAALAAARAGADVLVATKAEKPADASSDWAQGGIATTRGRPESLKEDVLDASAGTADEAAVDVLVEEASAAVMDVLVDALNVPFDTDEDGTGLDYAREAAHSEERILHVDAATGQHVLRPFLSHLEGVENVEVLEDTAALDLVTDEGRVHGAVLDRRASAHGDAGGDGGLAPRAPAGEAVYADATVLATGGIGDLFETSTNPPGSTGDGIAMAALAGADVADMEYVQFHPTAFDGEDSFLLSEAVRGEGAVLRNADGERFMPAYHPDAELAPRDVVARAVAAEREATGAVRLDVSPLAEPFDAAFPGLAAECEARGVDWESGIPVRPCEHFLCGGVDVDHAGRTSLDRLYAVGECARTGVHGANRLASTSLLEGLVWGLRAGRDAADREPLGAEALVVEPPEYRNSDPDLPERFAREKFRRLRRVTSECVGLRRDPTELARAQPALRRLKGEVDAYVRTRTARSLFELRNATVVALIVAKAAAENDESVGCHYRVDADGEDGETGDGEAEDDAETAATPPEAE